VRHSRVIRNSLFVLAAIAATVVAYFVPLLDWIAQAQIRIETWGAWGPVVYVLLYIMFTLCLIPGSALTFTAGLLYGAVNGAAISLTASTVAAMFAFLVSRYLARGAVANRFSASPRFRALDRAVGRDAWKIVILMRLSPAFPYVLLNYAFGLTRVRLTTFILFSLVGMIPATLLLTSAAAALGSAAEQASREMSENGSIRPPFALVEKREMNGADYRAAVTWLRNRQLVLWRTDETSEVRAQADLAQFIDVVHDLTVDGKATPVFRPGESRDKARARAVQALRDARHQAREAERFLAAGRAGTARERQKQAAAYLLEARGDVTVVNWGLWSVIGASLLVSLAVARMAQKALREAAVETRIWKREHPDPAAPK